MSYPHFPRPPMNIPTYPSNVQMNTSVAQTPPPLTVIPTGSTVLAYYQDFAWYFGIIQSYNLTRNGTLVYQVLFRSGEIRSVASSQVLSQPSNNQNIGVGSRVVVQHPTKSMLISSLVAELPSVENIFRYLLFLDDGSACYKTKDKLWVINLVENPIHMLPEPYKAFIQRYFTMTVSTVKLLPLSANDSVNFTNYDNLALQFSGKVAEVDCSIALIRYSINNGGLAEEWIHRGSSRILSYGHHPNPYFAGEMGKNNGSMKHLPPQTIQGNSIHKAPTNGSTNKRFIKSPLKSKQFMVPPSLDPFMFSDEENSTSSASKSGKHSTFNTWPVSNSIPTHNNSYDQPFSQDQAQPPVSPIVVLDESPTNADPPPYSSPTVSYFPDTNNDTIHSPKTGNENFLSPHSMSPCKPVSVFSWSAPEESRTRRHLELSPKIDTDVDFDFSDTILHTPVTAPSSMAFSKQDPSGVRDPPTFRKATIQHKPEEIIVIDADDPILMNEVPPYPGPESKQMMDNRRSPEIKKAPEAMIMDTEKPMTICKSPLVEVKDEFPKPKERLPMILHQEACSVDCDTSLETSTSTQNGNVIEVVVHGSSNGEAFISLAPTIEIVSTPLPEPLKLPLDTQEIKMETCPEQEHEQSKSRKRRLVSPIKSPKPIPKVKINLKTIADHASKDLAAQKCVKRARKQQSKESSKDSKQALAEKKKKIAKVSELKLRSLLVKKEPIKINSDAKISRWSAPWTQRLIGRSYHPPTKLKLEEMFGKILQKVETIQNDEELEEGELDDSDSEEPEVTATSSVETVSHKCSLLCCNYKEMEKTPRSPLDLPLQYGWKRCVHENSVFYVSPCGIKCTVEDQINTVLRETKCTYLFTSNFCFRPEISVEFSVPQLDFEPLFSDNDLSNGAESVPLPFVSNIGPIIKYNFHYIIDSIFEAKVGDSEELSISSCGCEDICSTDCSCRSSTLVRECNNLCSCSINCPSRIMQRGLQQQLQIIQEDTKFHVRTLHDIPPDTFICAVTGVVRRCVPESKDFVFPLSADCYSPALEITETVPEVDVHDDSKTNSSRSFFHEDSSLIISADLEIVRKRFDHKLTKFHGMSQYWTKTALKHNKVELLSDPSVISTYSSLCSGKRLNTNRAPRTSSLSDASPCSVPLYLDCTEYGNVGRFIPMGDDFNTAIHPVTVDHPTIPWLAVISTCTITRNSCLVLKPFDR